MQDTPSSISNEPSGVVDTNNATNRTSLNNWLRDCRSKSDMKFKFAGFENCEPWRLESGEISRPDGRFFKVIGVENLVSGELNYFISQPEIGILGFLTTRISGKPHLCVQIKDEPGNTRITQLAPTVQATHSNYTQAHGGKPTQYLEHFLKTNANHKTLSDSLQSEQGNKFWQKRNRNMNVFVTNSDLANLERHRLFPTREVLGLIDEDFAINTDARSVLSSCDWQNLLLDSFEPFRQSKTSFSIALGNSFFEKPMQSNNRTKELLGILEIARNKTDSKLKYHKITREDLLSDEFQNHIDFITVDSLNREVEHWSQPIYKSSEIESHVLISRVVDNSAEFLIRLSKEPGLLRKVEFGPSISALKNDSNIDEVFKNINFQKLISVVQSDEGGRFFRNISEYEIRLIDSPSSDLLSRQMEDSSSAYWVSAKTLNLLLREPEVTNNELRSVSSLLLKWV